jgi:hypothetical protein
MNIHALQRAVWHYPTPHDIIKNGSCSNKDCHIHAFVSQHVI